jgi:ATP-dependent DNA helicase PIF1
MTSLDRNERFLEAMRLLEETDRSLFITGKAGTGKSTLLSHFCETTRKKPVVLAPTGVAALNVRGQTIHNFFRFRVDVTPEKIRRRESRPRV